MNMNPSKFMPGVEVLATQSILQVPLQPIPEYIFPAVDCVALELGVAGDKTRRPSNNIPVPQTKDKQRPRPQFLNSPTQTSINA